MAGDGGGDQEPEEDELGLIADHDGGGLADERGVGVGAVDDPGADRDCGGLAGVDIADLGCGGEDEDATEGRHD